MNTGTQPISPGDMSAARLVAAQLWSAVVAPISFDVGAAECVVVAGRSGSGKTRLLRLVADLDEGGGEVCLDGISRSAFSAPAWRSQVVYQSAEPAWWKQSILAHFTQAEHEPAVSLAGRLALSPDRLNADISQLSTGERQRAALIRSLLKNPKVLLLDEPTSALDPENVGRVEMLLSERLRAGMALLLITHSQEQAARLSGRTIEVQRRQ